MVETINDWAYGPLFLLLVVFVCWYSDPPKRDKDEW